MNDVSTSLHYKLENSKEKNWKVWLNPLDAKK